MSDARLLEKVKIYMGITGTNFDERLTIHIDDVISFMLSTGISNSKISSSDGVVCRGVSDLFYNNGDYTDYFYKRITQLKMECVGDDNVPTE